MKTIVIHHPRKRIEAGKHFGLIAAFFGFLLAGCASTSPAHSAPPVEQPRATEQESLIAARTGLWDVTETVWASPGAAPVTTTGLVAERRMIGTMLQEVLRVGENVSSPVDRIDYLRYSRSEGLHRTPHDSTAQHTPTIPPPIRGPKRLDCRSGCTC
jgi:hypothetical protein